MIDTDQSQPCPCGQGIDTDGDGDCVICAPPRLRGGLHYDDTLRVIQSARPRRIITTADDGKPARWVRIRRPDATE